MLTSSVSVVIPCHNYARFLPEAVESVLAQTVKPLEIWVMDDGSTDDTPEVIASFGSRVRSKRLEGRGAYGARNDSVPLLSGDYFLNVDADNRLEPDFLEKTLACLEAGPAEAGYVYTQRRYFGDREGVSEFPEFDGDRLLLRNFVDMGSLIRMEHVKRFGFDERFNGGCGDHAFFLRLWAAGISGRRLNEPLLRYRVHGESITGAVRRRHGQVEIQRRLIGAFPELYTPEVAERALGEARNRTLVSLIQSRSGDAPWARRWREFLLFTRTDWRHAEWRNQFLYLFNPGRWSVQ
jgi:glycosyltransferase involved in cell wall biosynthesis